MDWSLSKLIRIEAAEVSISTNDLRALVAHYGLTDAERDRMLDMARPARQRSPWAVYKDVASAQLISYCGHESSASSIMGYQPRVVPALLQTSDYIRATIQSLQISLSDDEIDARVEFRLNRQQILERADRPKITFIIDEAVLRRVVGGVPTMRRQLEHLLNVGADHGVSLLVVPFTAGLYRLLSWPSVFLEFDDSQSPILFLELPGGDKLFREDDPDLRALGVPSRYRQNFWGLENVALDYSPRDLIAKALMALSG